MREGCDFRTGWGDNEVLSPRFYLDPREGEGEGAPLSDVDSKLITQSLVLEETDHALKDEIDHSVRSASRASRGSRLHHP